MKVIKIENGNPHTHMFHCPGCKFGHGFSDKIWTYNGDGNSPTIRASILVRGHNDLVGDFICHSFVTDGKIQFLNDCTHALAGQTVELPEL